MTPGRADITMIQGSRFQMRLTVKDNLDAPINITGWTANMQVRKGPGQPLVVEARSVGGTGGIISVVDGPNGVMAVDIKSASTATIVPDKYAYDLELIPPSGIPDKQQYVFGHCTVGNRITNINLP